MCTPNNSLEVFFAYVNLIHFRLLSSHVENLMKDFNENNLKDQPFMELLFSNMTLNKNDIIMLVMEIFLAGIDAVSIKISIYSFISINLPILPYYDQNRYVFAHPEGGGA